MKKIFLMIALSGATCALTSSVKSDPVAECDKLVIKLARGKLKPAKQTLLLGLLSTLRNRKAELERKLSLGLLGVSEQQELNQLLTYSISL